MKNTERKIVFAAVGKISLYDTGAGPQSPRRMKSDTPHIEILFFDVGNVLVSDDPSALFIYRRLYDHLKASQDGDAPTPEKFFEYRTSFSQKGGMLWDFVSKVLDDEEIAHRFQIATRRDLYYEWEKYSPAIPSMEQAVQTLYKEGWRLGILANQPPEVERLLRARKLWDLFDVHAVSDVLGFSKPDPRLFQRALEKAEVQPSAALMIGDRVDNDVPPPRRWACAPCRSVWMRHRAAGNRRMTSVGHISKASLRATYRGVRRPMTMKNLIMWSARRRNWFPLSEACGPRNRLNVPRARHRPRRGGASRIPRGVPAPLSALV